MINSFSPLNIFHPEFQIDGSREAFDLMTKSGIGFNRGVMQAQMLRYLLSCNVLQYQLEIERPVVLDFGAGVGTFKSFWDQNYQVQQKREIDYTGLEVSASYLEEGKNLGHHLIRFDANNDDIRKLSLERPDVILMQQFIEHIDPRAFDYLLGWVSEVLPAHGKLIISAPDPLPGEAIVEDHHHHEYPLEELRSLLLKHHLLIEQHFGWPGLGKPRFDNLSSEERKIHERLEFVSTGFANAVLCLINPRFAPYYYLRVRKL